MPAVFFYRGYKFFFFSNEGDPRERLHVHVRKGDATAKFWLHPNVSVAESYGMSSGELTALAKVAKARRDRIERCWNEFFGK